MADTFSKLTRSKVMSRIRSKNTKSELILKQQLKGLRLIYQPKIFGNPDFGSNKRRIAIFIDGCFWHKCPKHFKKPKSNTQYWNPKINNNVKRDRKITSHLKKGGWKVIRIWEHDVKKNPEIAVKKIIGKLRRQA